MLLLLLMSFLLFQKAGDGALLAARINQLFRVVLTTDGKKEEAAAEAEVKEIFTKRGIPTVAAVGDDAAYKFVFLACSPGSTKFQNEVLRRAREGAKRHEVPGDAVS